MFRLIAKIPGSKPQKYNGFDTYGQVSKCVRMMPPGAFCTIEKNVNGVWVENW